MLKQKKQTKLSSKFDPVPFHVTRIKGTMIMVAQNGRYVTRNASFLKKVLNGPCRQKHGEETDEELDDKHNFANSSAQPSDSRNTLTRRYPT